MKDLPHHIKKLNRQIVRSAHREELAEEAWEEPTPSPYARKQTKQELKKIAKRAKTKAGKKRAVTPLTPEERNKKMKKRTPIFDRNKAKPKTGARSSKKKNPRI